MQAGCVRVGRGRLSIYPFRALLAVGAVIAWTMVFNMVAVVEVLTAGDGAVGADGAAVCVAMGASMAALGANCLCLQGQQKRKADQRELTQHDSAGP
jgi:hypothetical protein